MNIKRASKSSLETFADCEFKYFLNYACGIRTGGSIATVNGSIAHHVLEIMAKCKLANKHLNGSKFTDPSYLLEIVFKHYQVINPTVNLAEKDKKFCRKMIDYVLASEYNPLTSKVLAVEFGFNMEMTRPGFSYDFIDYKSQEKMCGNLVVNGYMDVIRELPDGTIEIIDYKTGKYATDWSTGEEKTNENLHKDLQIRLYNLAARQVFKGRKIQLTVIYMQLNMVLTVKTEDISLPVTTDNLRRTFLQISDTNRPARLIDDKSRSKQHFKCKNVCDFGKTKGASGVSLCEEYYRILRAEGIEASIPKLVALTSSVKSAKMNKKVTAEIQI